MDLKGRILDIYYEYHPKKKNIISFLEKYSKKIFVVSTDKKKPPKLVKLISKQVGVPVYYPEKDLSVSFKKQIFKIYRDYLPKMLRKNRHVLDAISSAYYAKSKLKKQIDKYMENKIKSKEELIKSVLLKQGKNIIYFLNNNKSNDPNTSSYKKQSINKNKSNRDTPNSEKNSYLEEVIFIVGKTGKKTNENKYYRDKYKKLKKKYLDLYELLREILRYLSKEKIIAIKHDKNTNTLFNLINNVFLDKIDGVKSITSSYDTIFLSRDLYENFKGRILELFINKKVFIAIDYEILGDVVIINKYKSINNKLEDSKSENDQVKTLIKDLIRKYRYS